MRTLTAELAAQLALTAPSPGYLVQIDYPVVQRLSTAGDVTWNGADWLAADVRVRGLSADLAGTSTCTLEIGNADLAAGTLALGYGVTRRRIQVWCIYGGIAVASDTLTGLLARGGMLIGYTTAGSQAGIVLPVFDGIGAKPSVTAQTVIITTATPGEVRSSPRRFINQAAGFEHLQPAGTVIPWNGERFELTR